MVFCTKFAQKVYFWSKTEKVSITIELCIFKWVKYQISVQTDKFDFLDQIYLKKGIFGRKWKKWTSPLNFAYKNQCRSKMSTQTDNFDVLDQISPRRVFLVGNRKSQHHHWILHIRIVLGTKFQLRLTILNFWTKFAKKDVSGLKRKILIFACIHGHFLPY